MAAQEDPELTSSHRQTESIPTYRATSPEEDLRADWTATAHRGTTQQQVEKTDHGIDGKPTPTCSGKGYN